MSRKKLGQFLWLLLYQSIVRFKPSLKSGMEKETQKHLEDPVHSSVDVRCWLGADVGRRKPTFLQRGVEFPET